MEEQGIRAERKSIYDDMETLRDFGMDIHYRRGREGGYYEEKSASDKTEADNTIIHQPDGETGEKSENVQEQIGKESGSTCKDQCSDTLPNRREFKRKSGLYVRILQRKNPAYLLVRRFSAK